MDILRAEIAQLRQRKASVDPTAADPQMQVLVGLRERLRSNSTILLQVLAQTQKNSKEETVRGSRDPLLTTQLSELEAKLDGYVERTEERQRAMEATLKAILAKLENK